ncbi:MAG: hypothetical protein IKW67_01665 [Alphaproteobacteria bacterium]|nr:hypothetical protein [Alphaproteobacteria bacterium]
MKKIIFTTLICTAPIFANATDMCARDNVMVLAFDPQVEGTSSGRNAAEWSWWTQFPYGRIAGEATCLSAAEGLGQTSVGVYYGSGEYASTFITADSGLSGVDANGAERKYCWCKMTHPAVSRWVLTNAYANKGSCINDCSTSCWYNLKNNKSSAFKKAIFETIGM